MAALIQRVAQQALRTFTKSQTQAAFHESLQELTHLVHNITTKDINFDPCLVADQQWPREEVRETEGSRCAAPVTYLNLFEDDMITMGIFVLKHGVKLPLHDHPDMHGVIKVIHGAAAINSFTEDKTRAVPDISRDHLYGYATVKAVKRLQPAFVTSESPPCILGPEVGNFHEIHAPDGPMAFLDILAPPYDLETGARECNYYRELNLKSLSSNSHMNTDSFAHEDGIHGQQEDCFLVQIPQPSEFWCDTAQYRGPEIDPYSAHT